MIQITSKAKSELQKLLGRTKKAGQVLRLLPSPDGRLGIALTPERDGDEVIVADENGQLVISRRIAAALDGGVLDWEEENDEGKLSLSMRKPTRHLTRAS